MIQRSYIPGKWEKERSQINRTLLLRWVSNLFIHHRDNMYRLSVAVWWHFLVRLWVKLFVSQGLMQAFLACLRDINDLLFLLKNISWSKGNKDGNPSPHNCCLIIMLRCSGRKFLVWLCKKTSDNKHGWTPVKYLNVLHHNRTQK